MDLDCVWYKLYWLRMIIESSDGVGITKNGIFEILDCMSRLKYFIGRLMAYNRSLGTARVCTRRVEFLVSRRIGVIWVDARTCLVDASLMEFSPFSLGNARIDWASVQVDLSRDFSVFQQFSQPFQVRNVKGLFLELREGLETLFWNWERGSYVR